MNNILLVRIYFLQKALLTLVLKVTREIVVKTVMLERLDLKARKEIGAKLGYKAVPDKKEILVRVIIALSHTHIHI